MFAVWLFYADWRTWCCFGAAVQTAEHTNTYTQSHAETVRSRSNIQNCISKTCSMKYTSHSQRTRLRCRQAQKWQMEMGLQHPEVFRAVFHPSTNRALHRLLTKESLRNSAVSVWNGAWWEGVTHGSKRCCGCGLYYRLNFVSSRGSRRNTLQDPRDDSIVLITECVGLKVNAESVHSRIDSQINTSNTCKQPHRDMQRLSTAAATAKTTVPKHAA